MVGLAPLYLDEIPFPGGARIKILRFCSSEDTHPDHLDFIIARGYAQSFIEGVLEYLRENRRAWDVVKLESVREDSAIKKFLTESNLGEDLRVECSGKYKCPYLRIQNGFYDYLKSFSRKKRYNLLRKRKKLLEDRGIVYKITLQEEDPDQYLKDLFTTHAERARREGRLTSFYGRDKYLFHKMLIGYLSGQDKILLASIYDGSVPLSLYYCVKHNGKYYYYQTGLSPEGEKKSAGVVLISSLIEKAYGEGSKEFDFLRGDEEYKSFWTKTFRLDYSFIMRKNTIFGKLVCGYLKHYGKL